MFSLAEPNIHNIAIEGVFDDCQDIVKAVSADAAFKARLQDRHGQLDQLGARRRAGRLLFRRVFRGHAGAGDPRRFRGSVRQFRQHPRRARRARDGPADPPADPRDQRERRARRVLPHRPLPAARHRGDARDVEPVDGHLEGVELRALRVRHRRARSAQSCAISGRGSSAKADSTSRERRTGRASPRRASSPASARMPTASRRSATRTRAAASSSTRTRPTASRWGASTAIRRCRSSASRPRCRRSSPRRSARRSGATRIGPPTTPTSSSGRSAATCCPPTSSASRRISPPTPDTAA